ncbi:MAG TPA: hypothetical protein VI636_12670 [Candidatus Angelobacter sp.]
MSYLDSPRLHFRGWFQADVSTVNNDVRTFQNASFVPEYLQLNQNGSWNPEGTGIFRILDCSVTGGFLNGRQLGLGDDPAIGLTVQNADRKAPGKLVDLDPQQQMVSQIWGMQVRLVDPSLETVMRGEFKPAAFINLWWRQVKGARQDQQLAACYQSVLDQVAWADVSGSPLLSALAAAGAQGMLSIDFNVFGYGRDSTIPRFTMGHVVGTIGPYEHGEPKHFTVGRQLISALPPFSEQVGQVNTLQAGVAEDGMSLTADFGNSFQILEANSPLMNIGRVLLAVLKSNPTQILSSVDSSQVVVIGEVPYRGADWFTQTAGVQTFDLSKNADARQLLPSCPLVVLSPGVRGSSYRVLLQESVNGVYVRSDNFVFRLDPGETQPMEFYASRFGVPLANAEISLAGTEGFMGGSGGGDTLDPPARPAARIPDIAVPADGVSYDSSATTDEHGYVSVPLTANPDGLGPAPPRGYISGQLYGITYQLTDQPAGYAANPFNYISTLVYDKKEVPARPTWYEDIQYLFTQFGNLYPIMGKYVVDLRDYHSVVSRLKILKLAFSLPVGDPNYMPVSRDLGANDRETILRWLDTKGPDGLPLLGSPPLRPEREGIEMAAVAEDLPELPLLPLQSAGKTAVILRYEQRMARRASRKGESK